MAFGISDLEAGLLPDGGGRGIWGKPKFPQVAASPVGKEVVGDGGCQRRGPSGAGWGLVWAILLWQPSLVEEPPSPAPLSFLPVRPAGVKLKA